MKKTIIKSIVSVVMATALAATLAACTPEDSPSGLKTTPLAIPTNVKVNVGEEAFDIEQTTVTFDAVENATSYYIYVYEQGAEKAKVTITNTTTGELPNDLTAGVEYNVSVVAVSDNINYTNSNGSEPVKYTLPAWTQKPLAPVTNISMDWSKVDTENEIYPTLKFTGVSGRVSHYNVQIFEADKEGNKTGTEAATYFQVPANFGGEYMLTKLNYDSLIPGYYAIEVYASGDGTYYSDSEVATGTTAWTNVELPAIELTATEAENGGIKAEITNHTDYFLGMTFTFEVYSDEACTQLLTSKDVTYSSSEFFGNVSYTNSNTFTVKKAEEAGATDLKVGETYYVKAKIATDREIYKADVESEVQSITTTKETTEPEPTPGPGGGFEIVFEESYTCASDAASFDFNMGSHPLLQTTAKKKETATEGSTYSFVLETKDAGAPFKFDCTLELKADGTVEFHLAAAGPLTETNKTGTWTEADGTITIIIE